MNFSNLLLILWVRRSVLLIVLVACVVASLLLSLLLPKQYAASTSVVIEQKTQPLTGVVMSSQMMPGYLSTQIDIISSHTVALKVVNALKLAEQPDIRKEFQKETRGEGSLPDWIADNLLEYLRVRPSRDSNVIRIEFLGTDPQFAAELANAFADAYIQTSIELRVDPARRQAIWLEDQLQSLRDRLEQAQSRHAEFLKKNDIAGSDERKLDMENTKLEELAQQLMIAEGDNYEAISKTRQAGQAKSERAVQELPDVLSNPLVQSLKAELSRAEGRFAEISQRYDLNHPQYAAANAEVETLRAQLRREIETARNAVVKASRLAEDRKGELVTAFDQQKRRVIELQNQRNAQAVLQREVESARQTYDVALQRTSQVRMESQLNQTDIAVLNPALPPRVAATPKLVLNTLLGLICGGLLGIGAALLTEQLDRRLRSATDISERLGMPVLAEFAVG